MRLGIMQPYFMPYLGYWQLLAAVDTYIVYDDVNYIKGGWVSRNNILMNGSKHLFTITLNGASPNKLFNEIEIKDDFKKFRKTLEYCYKKAPFYNEAMQLMEQIITYEQKDLGHFMLHQFHCVLDYVGISTKLLLSSTVNKDNTLKGAEKIKHICNLLNADTYYNAIGGQDLYDKYDFYNSGINLYFVQPQLIPYHQFNNEFIAGLSMIDILMFNNSFQIQQMLTQYILL